MRSNFRFPKSIDPWDLLSKSEARRLARLRRLDRLRSDEAIHLARAVLWRELGVCRHLILRIVRDDGHDVKFQVEHVSLDRGGIYGQTGWRLEGARLRKDDSPGQRQQGIWLTDGQLWRRCLDGQWRRLQHRAGFNLMKKGGGVEPKSTLAAIRRASIDRAAGGRPLGGSKPIHFRGLARSIRRHRS